MSKLTDMINNPDNEETVAFDREELEKQFRLAAEEKTVLDERPSGYLDAELEAILRETEGYVIEPEGRPQRREEAFDEPEYVRTEPSENAKRVLEEQAEERKVKKTKKVAVICIAAVAALALVLVGILLLKNGSEKRGYAEAFKQAQIYYYDGEYDKALDELREALAIEKTDECLLLMSQCYEAKYDYVNAIAILESSNSDSKVIKKRIEKLKKDKEEYESGKIVLICGEQYDVATTTLDLSGQDIHSGRLEDLGKLTELTSLNLSGNQITELDFLRPLKKLTSLDLSDNKITDISPLSSLSSLRTLHLDNNKVEDFSPLYELDELTMLTIGGIEVKESQIKALKEALPACLIYNDEAEADVITVQLGGKSFGSDVSELDLSDCGITDISALSVCTALEKLYLGGNYIRDISPLLDIPKLKVLDISDNAVSDIRPLMSMTTIEHLNLANNNISSITALTELKNLRELVLNGNEIGGTHSLAKLTELRSLSLKNTGLTDADLSELYNLKNLQKLALEGNSKLSEAAVSTLEKKLPKCKITHSEFARTVELGGKQFAADSETVDASNLGIRSISAAAGFTRVRSMDLSGNVISDVSALSALRSLETLDLSDNNISDVEPLFSLTKLKKLNVADNGLSEQQIADLREALPKCSITVE